MKKIITSALLASLVIFYLPECKKSDKPQTTLEKIQGKWQLVSDVENDHIAGQDDITTYTGAPGDFLDFRADGKVYISIQGEQDTSTYTLSSDTKIVLDGTPSDIITLTSNSFIIHDKEISGADDFHEVTITLKK
jgi:hypothetical protein